MFYPKDFKKKVKKVYPNWKELHQELDNGNVFVGRDLRNSMRDARDSLSIATILSANSLKELKKNARVAQVKAELYKEWIELYQKQYPCT